MRPSFSKALSHTQLYCPLSKDIYICFSYKLKNKAFISIYKESETNHSDSRIYGDCSAERRDDMLVFDRNATFRLLAHDKKTVKTKEQRRRSAFICTVLNLLSRPCRTIFDY